VLRSLAALLTLRAGDAMSRREKLRDSVKPGSPKQPQKNQTVVACTCFQCGSKGTMPSTPNMTYMDDGTVRAFCSVCKSFLQGRRTRSGRDLTGQRFLCFYPIQEGE
jgi:hypothetical protein